jgi:peptidoglycan/LPS O-acetylase OafA/YrhL
MGAAIAVQQHDWFQQSHVLELLAGADVFRLAWKRSEENNMLGTILIIILILLLIGALPTWPYSTGWGYYPGGGLGLVLIIVVILVLVGRI